MTSLTSFLRGFATVLSSCARSWPGNVGFIGAQSEWPDAKDAVAALESAVAAGKIKFYGLCNFGTDDIPAFEAVRQPSSCSFRVQPLMYFVIAGCRPAPNR